MFAQTVAFRVFTQQLPGGTSIRHSLNWRFLETTDRNVTSHSATPLECVAIGTDEVSSTSATELAFHSTTSEAWSGPGSPSGQPAWGGGSDRVLQVLT